MIISPKTRVGELLDTFPDLESLLMEMSPAFEKLKNPILRKTVARVATLQQVAIVGGLNVDVMVNRLRKEVGQSTGEADSTDIEYLAVNSPYWFDEAKIVIRFDATPIINSGGSPMNDILHQTSLLKPGEIFELQTPFIPAPIIDMLKGKGYKVHCVQNENYVNSFVCK
ncbi:MAG: DUF1858 domain-containing protein [Bacteroidetes bacterium]|nr:MAG: DUF1858 domain-containing protein [Bacteroidota bacterium]